MKKIFFLIIFFLFINTSAAKELVSGSFIRCEDNDTIIFNIEDEEKSFSLLGIQTLDSNYICNLLQNSINVLIEYDNAPIEEKGKTPVWFWVNEVLLQEIAIKEGVAKVLGDEYKYTKALCKIQDDAINLKKGIWELDKDKGLCATFDYSNAVNNIVFEETFEEAQKTPVEEISESLEKIDNTITNITDNNMDKIATFYLYGFLALAFLVFIIREIKK